MEILFACSLLIYLLKFFETVGPDPVFIFSVFNLRYTFISNAIAETQFSYHLSSCTVNWIFASRVINLFNTIPKN